VFNHNLQESINLQKDYRRTFFTRKYHEEELREIEKQIESNVITMQWFGTPYPLDLLKALHNKMHQNYLDIVEQEVYIKSRLEKRGLSNDDLLTILKGSYNKKEPLPEKEEEKIDSSQDYIQ
jgi:hypothetical protein